MSFFEIENLRFVCDGIWLQKPRNANEQSVVGVGTDTREELSRNAFVALRGERFDGHDYLHQATERGASLLIVDRDVPLPAGCPAFRVDDARRALCRMAAAYREHLNDVTVVAITGSVGKTTTKQLIAGVLATTLEGTSSRRSFNNDIGVPLTVLSAIPSDDYLVVEIGMNAPGEIASLAALVRPDIAIITHIGHGHLEGVGSVDQVAREKFSLLEALSPAGMAVLNIDVAPIRDRLNSLRTHRSVTYGTSPDADVRLAHRAADGVGQHIETTDGFSARLGIAGRHNAVNALAAVVVGRMMGVPDASIGSSFASAKPVAMRLNVEQRSGVQIVNDAYNANPESMMAALDAFAELSADSARRIVVLGDMLELGSRTGDLHGDVLKHLLQTDAQQAIHELILIGDRFRDSMHVLCNRWADSSLHLFPDSGAAAQQYLASVVNRGDAVLLKGSRGMKLERLLDSIADPATSPNSTSVELKPAAPSEPMRATET